MKKILIVALLLVFVSCSSTKSSILDVPNTDFDVCGEAGCVSDYTTSFDYFVDVYRDQLDLFIDYLESYQEGAQNNFEAGTFIERSELNFDDPLQGTSDFTFYYDIYIRLNHYVEIAGRVLTECDKGEECEPYWLFENQELLAFDYGFSEVGGYATYTTGNNNVVDSYIYIKFALNGSNPQFLYYEYNNFNSSFRYESLKDGIYQVYEYVSDDEYNYRYFDIATLELVNYSLSTTNEVFRTYVPDSQTLYFSSQDSWKVARYLGKEQVAYVNNSGPDLYGYHFNFNFVPDWDEIYFFDPLEPPTSRLYENGVEVYSEYSISAVMNRRYADVGANISGVSETELLSLPFPESFTGGVSLQELFDELTILMNEEDHFANYGITPEDILSKCHDLAKLYEDSSIK